jgi:hypothetical protein
MRGQGTKGTKHAIRLKVIDEGRREHMATAAEHLEHHDTKAACSAPPTRSPKDWEVAYEGWYRWYVDQASARVLGVYAPTGASLAVRFDNEAKETVGRRRGIRWLMKHFNFFPNTEVPSHRWFASDTDAILNDWAMIGSDLYGAVQQYKIESACVRTNSEISGTAVTAPR